MRAIEAADRAAAGTEAVLACSHRIVFCCCPNLFTELIYSLLNASSSVTSVLVGVCRWSTFSGVGILQSYHTSYCLLLNTTPLYLLHWWLVDWQTMLGPFRALFKLSVLVYPRKIYHEQTEAAFQSTLSPHLPEHNPPPVQPYKS